MATGLGFCPNCGTPRVAADQKFCPTCGTALAAIDISAPVVPVPVETEPAPVEAAPPPPPWAAPAPPAPVEAAPPPPPAWAAPAAITPPPAPPADFAPAPPPWAAPAPVSPPPAAPTDYAPPAGYAPPPPPSWGAPAGQGYPPAPPQYGATPVPPQYAAAPVPPAQVKSRTSPALLLVALLLIVGIVAGGFYFLSNKGTPGSSGNPTVGPGGTNTALGTPGGNGGGGLVSAANNFASIKSYKFSMTLAGGSFGSMLSALPGAGASGDTPFTMSGTVTTNPSAADITMASFHIIEVGGFEYVDLGTGQFIKSPSTGTSMADSLSPATMFSSAMDTSAGSGYSKVGTDNKNGVTADHYKASSSALSAYGSTLGVPADATWSADVWIAQNGGYPVSMSILAIGSDKSVLYEITFDISNINDPSNNVTAPTNVLGA